MLWVASTGWLKGIKNDSYTLNTGPLHHKHTSTHRVKKKKTEIHVKSLKMCARSFFLQRRTEGHEITLMSSVHIQWTKCVCETCVCLQWSYAGYSTGNSRPWIYCFQGSRRLQAPGVCPRINITMTHIDPTTACLLHHWDKVASIATERGLAWWLRIEWRKIGTEVTSHGKHNKENKEKNMLLSQVSALFLWCWCKCALSSPTLQN